MGAELDTVLRLALAALQTAQAYGLNMQHVADLIDRAEVEGRDITTEELRALSDGVRAKLDRL